MTWDNDGNRISAISGADGPGCFGISQLFRKLSVAPCLTEWYGQKGFPNVVLKTSASHVKREGK